MDKKNERCNELKKSFGGYMAVDRVAALKHNWKKIKSLTLPGQTLSSQKSPDTSKEK